MGLNYAFVLVLERRDLPRLNRSIAARLVRDSAPPDLAQPLMRVLEDGDYRFATSDSSPCLAFVDPTYADEALGCVYLERVEGRRYALISLRAATSSMSRRFEEDLGIRTLIMELSAEGGVLAVAFDREEERLTGLPGVPGDGPVLPLDSAYLPFWCSPGSAPLSKERRKRALDDRASIIGARLPGDSDAAVLEALLDDDAFEADVDGYATELLVAIGR